jgi:hypothetical protein
VAKDKRANRGNALLVNQDAEGQKNTNQTS